MKTCETCGVEIPEDYNNLLCDEHYKELENQDAPVPHEPSPSPLITDPSYVENPEVDELDLIARCVSRFKNAELVMPKSQFELYRAIRDSFDDIVKAHPQYPKFIWNPKVCDVGCGLGIGTNILSERADFVWGIDKNVLSVKFARQMFTRTKNSVYWSPQVTFDIIDVNEEPRDLMRFDVVTCVEVIEHFADPTLLIKFLKRLEKLDTIFYISTPNRQAWRGQERASKPQNIHHVREYTPSELSVFLGQFWGSVEVLDTSLNPIDMDSEKTPMVFKCHA